MSERSHTVPTPEGEYFESNRFAGLSSLLGLIAIVALALCVVGGQRSGSGTRPPGGRRAAGVGPGEGGAAGRRRVGVQQHLERRPAGTDRSHDSVPEPVCDARAIRPYTGEIHR